jgi:hypothetical protein
MHAPPARGPLTLFARARETQTQPAQNRREFCVLPDERAAADGTRLRDLPSARGSRGNHQARTFRIDARRIRASEVAILRALLTIAVRIR